MACGSNEIVVFFHSKLNDIARRGSNIKCVTGFLDRLKWARYQLLLVSSPFACESGERTLYKVESPEAAWQREGLAKGKGVLLQAQLCSE